MTTESTPPPEIAVSKRVGRRRAWRAVLLCLFILICGGLTGWGVAFFVHPPHRFPPPGAMFPDPPVGDLVAQLKDELLLSDDQAKQVTAIYQERFAALHAIRQDM